MSARSSDELPPYDYTFKILLVGESTVGKTSLLTRFADNDFSETFIATIGIDFKVRYVPLESGSAAGRTAKLQVWDTAGQERFRTITTAYYRGADAVILCYDSTNAASFTALHRWMRDIRKLCGQNRAVPVVIVATKIDMVGARQVSKEEGRTLATEYGVPHVETSSKTGYNVQDLFRSITHDLVEQYPERYLQKAPPQPVPGIVSPKQRMDRERPQSTSCLDCSVM